MEPYFKKKYIQQIAFNYGTNVKLTKFTRESRIRGWVITVYGGVISEMGNIDDNRPTPNTSDLEPVSIRLKDGSLINFGNKYELRLI